MGKGETGEGREGQTAKQTERATATDRRKDAQRTGAIAGE